jgi:hypothetical protein
LLVSRLITRRNLRHEIAKYQFPKIADAHSSGCQGNGKNFYLFFALRSFADLWRLILTIIEPFLNSLSTKWRICAPTRSVSWNEIDDQLGTA